ncbi:hypothetical protein J3Q64DRAFT_1858703 [Phycomyces blakesleeanus]|uniref:F-box domain-containing protein n=1 Tax=Phycomyces blakesleeanus TaxID=4837 RepID=A0ABR3BJS9_PHYBL
MIDYNHEVRLWEGNDGKFQVMASYAGLFKNTKVKLQKVNGSMIAIPLDFLCHDDISYISATLALPSAQNPHLPIFKPDEFYSSQSSDQLSSSSSSSKVPENKSQDSSSRFHEKAVSVAVTTKCLDNNSLNAEYYMSQHVQEKYSSRPYIRTKPLISSLIGRKSLPVVYSRPFSLSNLPDRVLVMIGFSLDVRSRIRLASTCQKLFKVLFYPEVWSSLWFLYEDLYTVNDSRIIAIAETLVKHKVQNLIESVNLDGSVITALTVINLLKYFPCLEYLSIRTCWQVFSLDLATRLDQLANDSLYGISLSHLRLGKVLLRGPVKDIRNASIDSKSYGQDVGFITHALSRLAGHLIDSDCHLCQFCNLGAAISTFDCAACGRIPLTKCYVCAPQCNRCSIRVCGTAACRQVLAKLQTFRCARCENPLSLCNTRRECIEAQKSCSKCDGVYHTQCRMNNDIYVSNKCSKCGVVCCPRCELVGCSGGCLGQWCHTCANKEDIKHCKCFIVQKSVGNSVLKRNVCRRCRRSCKNCGGGSFCVRCLGLHVAKCKS